MLITISVIARLQFSKHIDVIAVILQKLYKLPEDVVSKKVSEFWEFPNDPDRQSVSNYSHGSAKDAKEYAKVPPKTVHFLVFHIIM